MLAMQMLTGPFVALKLRRSNRPSVRHARSISVRGLKIFELRSKSPRMTSSHANAESSRGLPHLIAAGCD